MGKEMDNGDAADASADAVDVSAVGTLVWVRRPNGSWWPGRVVSPHEVPESCPPPPRSPATPILLLGRRDGPVFIDWCNLERCKRVKPFRCGEPALEDCIRMAEEQQAARSRGRRDQRVSAGVSRYARKEDAVLQALDIERARLRLRSSSKPTATAKPSHSVPAPAPAPAPATTAVPSTRKRRTPNDSEDDAPQRMKDLSDIGVGPKKMTPSAGTYADLNQHLPSTTQMKRSKKSHHDSAAAKTKQSWLTPDQDQDQPCGALRKRDRSRPLSELCNGDTWENRLKPRQRANQQFMRAASSLDTVMVRTSSRRATGPVVKLEPVDDTFPCGSDVPVEAHLAVRSLLKADHLHVHQPNGSAKAPTWESTKRTSNRSKDGVIPSQRDSRNSKKKTTSSVAHEGGKKIKIEPGCEDPKERAAKHRAASNGVVLLERRTTAATTADKTAAYKDLAAVPNGLGRVGAVVLQHQPLRRCKLEQPSEAPISNLSTRESVPAPSVVFELPPLHQVVPPQHRAPAAARCLPAVKPVKTLQLNSPSIYNVELSAQGAGSTSGSSKGGRVPLVSLMSRSSRRPVVGYPVSVEVLDTAPRPPAPSMNNNHRPSTSHNITTNRAMKEEKEEEPAAAAPRRAARPPPPPPSSQKAARVTRAKAKSRRKASEDDDELWRPHTKNSDLAVAAASPRKMRRLSSLAPSRRGVGRRTAAVGELGRGGPALACVPLRLVFSRIHEALAR